MTTKAVFRSVADQVFTTFADMQVSIYVKQITPSNVRGVAPNETNIACSAIYHEYDSKEYSDVIVYGDTRLYVRYTELAAVDQGDEVVWDGSTWQVVRVRNDYDVLWTLQVRK